jgi:methionyl-tRNA synthetase
VLHKEERAAELDVLLYDLCEGLRWAAILLYPFNLAKPTEIWRQLGLRGTPSVKWAKTLHWGGLAAQTQTALGDGIFPRIDPPVPA